MRSEPHNSSGFRWTTLLRPRWASTLFIAFLALLRLVAAFIPTRIDVGPETTYLEGPLRPDGTVDYAAAINRELPEGVEPDLNAVVDLLRAFGPQLAQPRFALQILQSLGLEEMPSSGPYLVSSFRFIDGLGLMSDSDEERAAWNEFFEAEKHPWTAKELPLVARWITRNEEPLQHVLAATRKPKYYVPVIVDPDEPYLHTRYSEDLRCYWNAARLLKTRAMLAVGEGHSAEAFEYSLACHRLARLVSQNLNLPAYPASLEASAMRCDDAIVLSSQLSVEEVRCCREQLAALPGFSDSVEQFVTVERYGCLDFVQAVHSGRCSNYENQPRAGSFDPNPALRQCNELIDAYLAAFSTADRRARRNAIAEIERSAGAPSEVTRFQLILGRIVGSPVPAGQEFADRLRAHNFPQTQWMIDLFDKMEARVQLVNCAYAIAEYRITHDEYPPSLESLVPGFMQTLPIDPFAGDPLRYRREHGNFVLYSVGENEVDDGGIDVSTGQRRGVTADDLVIGTIE